MRRHRSRALSGVAAVALLAACSALPAPVAAHPVAAPPPEELRDSVIPPEDQPRYRSTVTAVDPPVPGLEVRIVGGQDKMELTWLGREPLVVLGRDGEPMLRFSGRGVEANRRSPSAYRAAERFARVDVPAAADPDVPPRWTLLTGPGPFSWYEHRAQWMRAQRPKAVTDPAERATIFDWEVPATIGARSLGVRGVLEWVPDPEAFRAERSAVSTPLLSLLVLTAALALGAVAGVGVRRRLEGRAAPIGGG